MEDKDKKDSKNNELNKQRENADQGFTVRDGHNPNKPNPYEKPNTKEEVGNYSIPDEYEEDENPLGAMEGDKHEENNRENDLEK